MTYGLGNKSLPLAPRRASRSPTKPSSTAPIIETFAKPPPPALAAVSKRATRNSLVAAQPIPYPSPAPSPPRDASPPPTHSAIPRCIPLHGHLGTVSCGHCSTTLPIEPFLPDLAAGQTTPCPKCTTIDDARASLGERSRGVGKLRPDVVLYGEEHKDGERVGEITRRDLMGVRPDLLLVVGTSLKVPGTKRLVRELSKVIKPGWIGGDAEDEDEEMPSSSAASSSSRRKPKPPPVHTIYLNYEFPKPASEWKDVFDVWMRGDVQQFVKEVEGEKRKEEAKVEQRRREKEEKERKRMEKELKAKAAPVTASRATAGASTKKAQATITAKMRAAKAMVPQPTKATTGKTKTAGGAAKPRSRASAVVAPAPAPSSRASTRSRSPSSAPSTSTTTSITSSTRRRTSNSLSAAVQAVPATATLPLRRGSRSSAVGGTASTSGQQRFTLTFNVTKAGVGAVTGTK